MSPDRRFEQELPALLDDLYLGPMPTYRDHILQQTVRSRQRPAWLIPERWLPMVDIAGQPLLVRRLPWRTIGLVVLLMALLVVALAALAVGARPNLPPPFGPAANGLVAYASGGDIYTVDPASGIAKAVVTGTDTDFAPVWSRDGTHIAFEREVVAGSAGRLYVAQADGTALVAITTIEQAQLASSSFSPDGSAVVFTAGADPSSELWIAKADGSGARQINVGLSVREQSYRPPNGAEVIFAADPTTSSGSGIYLVDVATGTLRTIVKPSAGVTLDRVTVAPNGSRVVYVASTVDPARNTYRVHVAAIDGSRDVTLPMPQGATFQDAPAWSNDSSSLVIVRGYSTHNQAMTLAVLPADGSGVGVESARGLTGCCDNVMAWAPDDRSVLVDPENLSGETAPQLLLDPATGATLPIPWVAEGDPAWQRLAP